MSFPRIPRWLWFAWLALGGLLELVALANGVPDDTLSALLLAVPAWLGAGLLGWAAWHFAQGWVYRRMTGRRPPMR